jgi:hypothetical protein
MDSAAAAAVPLLRAHPLFRCAWERALMIHYTVDPSRLQPEVAFPLDLHGGRAYVSLVAFTLRGLRFAAGGPPLATHGFLNVRTYVTVGGEKGIFFLAEWLPHRLCVLLGPRLYGLPYRHGLLDYRHEHERGELRGRVDGQGATLAYRGRVSPGARYAPCAAGSLDAFLMERYAAFTARGRARRVFRVEHPPWPQTPAEVEIEDDRLVATTGAWFRHARPAGANYSPGFGNVGMGRPLRLGGIRP